MVEGWVLLFEKNIQLSPSYENSIDNVVFFTWIKNTGINYKNRSETTKAEIIFGI